MGKKLTTIVLLLISLSLLCVFTALAFAGTAHAEQVLHRRHHHHAHHRRNLLGHQHRFLAQHRQMNGGPAFTRAAELAQLIGVRTSLAVSVVGWESGGNYHAKARTTSASGPMQVLSGTASSIAGRQVSRHERMSDTGLKLGVAYLAACQEAMPRSTDRATWQRCFVAGHGNVGAHIQTAQRAFARLASR